MLTKENIIADRIVKFFSLSGLKDYIWIVSFTFLTAIGAQITIPVQPVPFTLQTLFVILAGGMLGAKRGAYSMILYLALGCMGLPVFAQTPDATIGIAKLFGPTGGYLISFPFAALLTGFLIEKFKNPVIAVISFLLGDIFIILFGTLFLNVFYIHNFSTAFQAGAALFTLWMFAKVIAASVIFFSINKFKKGNLPAQ
jgi:biotin transport system substrate-specific component